MNTKILAFYLPQFHIIKENNEWWGPGFTEWTNVAKARPLYDGHYQPKIPADLGFYDLRVPETRIAQAELAKRSGVYGFAYWHYWFGGKRLLERPIEEVLSSGQPDFPFCFFWANHSWYAKTWDPKKPNKLLIEQTYSEEDYVNHFNYLLPIFKDERYIKVGNRPLFGIYSAQSLPDAEMIKRVWNELAIKNGFAGIYFMTYSFNLANFEKCKKLGFDADVLDVMDEATGITGKWNQLRRRIIGKLGNQFFSLKRIDYSIYSNKAVEYFAKHKDNVPCILPNYDHSPRSGKRAPILENSTPSNFKKLLEQIKTILDNRDSNNEFLVIKSWNEWGEGNYLEPDQKYGHGYLNAIKEVFSSDED